MWTGADDETPDIREGRRAIAMPFLAALLDTPPRRGIPHEPSGAVLLAADRARRARHRAMQPTWDAICRSLAREQARQRRAGC